MSGFRDVFTCPKCRHKRVIYRMGESAGKTIKSFCTMCRRSYSAKAGVPDKAREAREAVKNE